MNSELSREALFDEASFTGRIRTLAIADSRARSRSKTPNSSSNRPSRGRDSPSIRYRRGGGCSNEARNLDDRRRNIIIARLERSPGGCRERIWTRGSRGNRAVSAYRFSRLENPLRERSTTCSTLPQIIYRNSYFS